MVRWDRHQHTAYTHSLSINNTSGQVGQTSTHSIHTFTVYKQHQWSGGTDINTQQTHIHCLQTTPVVRWDRPQHTAYTHSLSTNNTSGQVGRHQHTANTHSLSTNNTSGQVGQTSTHSIHTFTVYKQHQWSGGTDINTQHTHIHCLQTTPVVRWDRHQHTAYTHSLSINNTSGQVGQTSTHSIHTFTVYKQHQWSGGTDINTHQTHIHSVII